MTNATTTEELIFLGSRVKVLAHGIVEMIEVPAGDMPPLHVHHSSDECFYVIDGEVTLYLPGAERTLGPGDFILAPRGVPHTYRVGEEPCHWLVVSQPAGFERFVAAVAALDEPTPDELAAIAADHDIEILGPPGTLP